MKLELVCAIKERVYTRKGDHTLVHEGGYTIQRVDNNKQRLDEQFIQQQHTDDISLFDFERVLRNSKESFNAVRKVSPTQYRFRIVDAQGKDILDRPNERIPETNNLPTYQSHYSHQLRDSTRISCSESIPNYFHNKNNDTYEQPSQAQLSAC